MSTPDDFLYAAHVVERGTRRGRPAGSDGGNRERIVAAARAEFAAKGFRGATLRSIAARAGTDVALLAHYFVNKDGLFAATITMPEEVLRVLPDALSGDVATQGERLTRRYLALWEDPRTGPQMLVLARSATGNEVAAASLQRLVSGTINRPEVAPLLRGREEGFLLAMAHLLGIALSRHLARVPQVAQLDLDTLVTLVAPATQHYLTLDAG
jgi:AcrR family transcriptional regulator